MVEPFKVAKNPETGDRIYFDTESESWKPYITAKNPETGDRVFLKNGQWQPVPEVDASFLENLEAGARSTANLMYHGGDALLKSLIGELGPEDNVFKQSAKKAFDKYVANETAIQRKYNRFYDDFRDVETFNDVLQYAQESLGRGVPSFLVPLVMGPIGRALVGSTAGMTAGVLIGTASQNFPESYVGLKMEGVDAPLSSVIAGSIKTGLDALAPSSTLKNIYGEEIAGHILSRVTGNILKNAGVSVRTAAIEGLTEAAQEAVDVAAENFYKENKDLFTEENLVRMIDSGIQGAIVGGGIGATTQAVSGKLPNVLAWHSSERDKEAIREEITKDHPFDIVEDNYIKGPLAEHRKVLKALEDKVKTIQLSDESVALPNWYPVKTGEGKAEIYLNGKMMLPSQKAGLEPVKLDYRKSKHATDKEWSKVLKDADYRTSLKNKGFEVVLSPTGQQALPLEPSIKYSKETGESKDTTKNSKDVMSRIRQIEIQKPKQMDVRRTRYAYQFAHDYLKDQGPEEASLDEWFSLLRERTILKDRQGYKALEETFKGVNKISKPMMLKAIKEQALKAPAFFRNNEYLANALRRAIRGTNGITVVKDGVKFDEPPVIEPINSVLHETDIPDPADNPEYGFKKPVALKVAGALKNIESFSGRSHKSDIFRDVEGFRSKSVDRDSYREQRKNQALSLSIRHAKSKNRDDLQDSYEAFWHGFYSSENIKKSDREFSDKEIKKMAELVSKITELNLEDSLRNYMDILPTLFGYYMRGKISITDLPSKTARNFSKAEKLLTRTYNALRATGENIRDISDIMNGISEEDVLTYEESIRQTHNANKNLKQREERVQELMEDSLSIFTDEKSSLFSRETDHPLFQKLYDYFKHIVSVPMFIAQSVKGFAPVEAFARTIDLRTHQRLSEYLDIPFEIMSERPASFNVAMDTLAWLRMNNVKRVRTKDGYYLFKDKNGVEHYTNPDAVEKESPIKAQWYRDFNALVGVFDRHLEDAEKIALQNFLAHGVDISGTPKEIAKRVLEVKNRLKEEVEGGEVKGLENILKEEYDHISENLKGYLRLELLKNSYYAPFLRFGTRIITVTDPDKNLPAYVAFVEENFLGERNKTQLEIVKKELEELGYLDNPKYIVKGLKDYEVKRPTYSKASTLIEELKEHGITDLKLFGNSLLETMLVSGDEKSYNEMSKRLEGVFQGKAISGLFAKAHNIPGYSTDWGRVINAWGHFSANFITKIEYQSSLSDMKNYVDFEVPNDPFMSPRMIKYTKKYFDYVFSYKADMPTFRAWNFLLAMGWNPSTAALQLLNGPMAVVPWVMQIKGNALTENGAYAKILAKHSRSLKRISLLTGQIKTLKEPRVRKQWEKDFGALTAKDLALFVEHGHIEAVFTQDHTDNRRSETRDTAGKAKGLFEKIFKSGGSMISLGEQISRLSSVTYLSQSLQDPSAFAKAKDMLKDDTRYQALKKALPEYNERQVMILHALDTTHGVFGKAGRGMLQRGVWGSLITPFMTHPTHQLFLMRNLLKGHSKKQKMAGIYFLMPYLALGGLMALPGAEFMTEAYELLIRVLFGVEEDFEKEFREFLVEEAGTSPEVALTILRGIPRGIEGNPFTLSRVDLSSRVNLALPFQQPFLSLFKYMKGQEGVLADMLGPTVGYIGNTVDFINTGDPANLLPNALKNAYKSLIDYGLLEDLTGIPTSQLGARTTRGTPLASPEELSLLDKVYQLIGVRPALIVDRQERKYYERLAGTFFLPAYRRAIKDMSDEYVKMYKAKKRGDLNQVERHKKKIEAGYKDLIQFMKKYNIPMSKTRLRTIRRSIRDNIWSTLDPRYTPRLTKMGKAESEKIRSIFDPYSEKD